MRNIKITYKLIIFLIVGILSAVFAMPSILGLDVGKRINLGLDLQGGLYMLLDVETDEAIASKIKSVASSISYTAKRDDLLLDNIKIEDDYFEFSILDDDEAPKFQSILKGIDGLEIQQNGLNYVVHLTEAEAQSTKDYAVEQAVETIRNRLDQFGLAEPTVAKQGKSEILVEIPGVKTEEERMRAKELIAKAAHLQLMELDEKRQDQVYNMSENEAKNYGDIIYPDAKEENMLYLIKEIPVLDGSMLVDAKVAFDQQTNQPIIHFTLNSEGAKIFGDFTGENVGHRLAIVLDGKVYSAPRINERIGGGSGQISGAFTIEEARDVAIALRSGALLAPVKIGEERSIGPSLGQESIDKSLNVLIIAGLLVVVFMIVYYGVAGIFADIALVVNILFLVSAMALFGATLTLPGMAGIVLTVGMAVDANVIINERIREVLKTGALPSTAIKKGYEHAMSAIIDANLTTLITSAALYSYGSGPVKGFAVTLSIGVIASMLTAIIGTHGMFELVEHKIDKSRNLPLWFGYKIRKEAKNADI